MKGPAREVTPQLRRRFLLSLLFGFLVLTALGLVADLPKMLAALSHFTWGYLPAILGLTAFNYFLRYVKFHYYLTRIAVRVSLADSLAIFLSGLSMAMTPGKVGELLKAFLLRSRTGTPISRTAPVIMAERLTDGLAMLLLASAGLLLYRQGLPIFLLVIVGAVVLIAVVQVRPLSERLLDMAGRLPVVGKRAVGLRAFYESSYQLLWWPTLLLAVALGFVSWSGECVAFYYVLIGLGFAPSWLLLVQAAFVLAISTLAGSVSLLPGGLGVAEGSVYGLLLLLLHTTTQKAGAATLLIRFCTLWFGVSIGIVALFLFSRRFGTVRLEQEVST
ncbi:MAG: lysylphosphatidylglycerol synthase transmembrane domain-containing protein [Chloroflexota bacterium]